MEWPEWSFIDIHQMRLFPKISNSFSSALQVKSRLLSLTWIALQILATTSLSSLRASISYIAPDISLLDLLLPLRHCRPVPSWAFALIVTFVWTMLSSELLREWLAPCLSNPSFTVIAWGPSWFPSCSVLIPFVVLPTICSFSCGI